MRNKKLDYRALVAEYERGTELTQRQFCELRGAVAATFKHWLYRLRGERGVTGGFVPLNIVGSPQPDGVVVEIEYPCGAMVRLSGASPSFILGLVPSQRT
jgi:hypothetical protein